MKLLENIENMRQPIGNRGSKHLQASSLVGSHIAQPYA
jgi:hypothetical protein